MLKSKNNMIEKGQLREVHQVMFGEGRFNHCASICPYKKGVLIAWYSGDRECDDTQSVYLTYYEDNGNDYGDDDYSYDSVPIGELTGNPIIWSDGDEATILYSRFEKDTEYPVHRWKYCSNWIRSVEVQKGKISFGEEIRFKTNPELGFLGRCQPIKFDGQWLLPIYKEHNCYGQIFIGNGLDYKPLGKIGLSNVELENRFGSGILIQPTLWHDGQTIYSLSRDITDNRRAWFSESDNGGKTWTKPTTTLITNYNNSIVAIHDHNHASKEPMIVWNQTESNDHRSRRRMLLGQLRFSADGIVAIGLLETGRNLFTKLNESTSASYPNYCFDNNGNLHIVHSDYPCIRHHVFKLSQP